MEVNISEHSCTTKVYCKTDHFPFNVISLPFLESNIDVDLCHGVFFSQIIRFERLSTNREDFECRTRYLGNILRQRGYYINTLEKLFSKCIIKYAVEFQKWSLPANTKTWFYNIINNQPTGLIPPVVVSNSFSQPLLGATAVINAQTHFSQP